MLRRRLGDNDDKGMTHYQMRQNLVSIGDDFWIENDRGQKVFRSTARRCVCARRWRSRIRRHELCKIQERMMRVKDSMEIEGPGGERVAMVKKALITPVRERWEVKIGDGPDLEVQGNILDHEYTSARAATRWPKSRRSGSALRDSYGVEIAPGQNDVVVLAATVAVDMMAH